MSGNNKREPATAATVPALQSGSTSGAHTGESITRNGRPVKDDMIHVAGYGYFDRATWTVMMSWSVNIILDMVENGGPRDYRASRARSWLRANGIMKLDDVRRIGRSVVRCRFCDVPLSAMRSRVLGYGERCGRQNGLPY